MMKSNLVAVALAGMAVFLCLVAGPLRSYAAQAQSPVEVVKAYYDDLNSGDFDKAHSLLQDDLKFMFDIGNPDIELIQTLYDQIPGITDHKAHFTILSIEQTGDDIVQLVVQIDATDLAELNLAHPYTSRDMATVHDGKIVAYSGTTSDQTKADLAAADANAGAQPGMPKTGESSLAMYAPLITLALVTVACGLGLRRARVDGA